MKLPPRPDKAENPAQRKLYDFIVKFSRDTWSFPTPKEMGKHMGVTGSRTLQMLQKLEKSGHIEKIDKYNRRLVQIG